MREPSIELSDVLPRRIYELIRPAYVREIIELKRSRRLRLSSGSVLFECRETVLFLIHELARAEGLDDAGVARAIAEHRCLVPRPGTLAATLFIDGSDAEQCSALAQRISTGDDVLGLCIGRERAPARVLAPAADLACPVHYLSFTIGSNQRAALLDPRARVVLESIEPDGRHRCHLGWDTRRALGHDLRGPWSRAPIMGALLHREAALSPDPC